MLTGAQVAAYARDGYLAVPDFLAPRTCAALIDRAEQIAAEQAPTGPRSRFSTTEQARSSDAWFLGSGDQLRCFFEADAFTPDGALRVAPERAVNKIGHALHDLDPGFAEVSYDPRLVEIAAAIGMRAPLAVQSMAIFKQPGVGGEVAWHQDATFLYTEPLSVVGFWFALEDATRDNGCLWVAPGEQRGPLRRRFRREGDGVGFALLDAAALPGPTEPVALPVRAGTLVLLHGLLPHWSGANRSPRRRLAYSLHCVEADAVYPADNWLQRGPQLPFRRLAAGSPLARAGALV
ncbi:MAG: phytanoyl-CoA dioxygenase family protein [Nannocystis sp.]|uniref:phytanoyl-CoA dioxygenase family protein n=1 Tax=Nannocystis sp. TaxID=1962667 RepID=UPI0024290910|nr:phytanoyl-CoA dioxygenase family protein [Nannocystis sp.]MBK9757820.1 phytanoyl-CoA dioxygenase family protein [Nannocystis sp.]